MRWNMITRFLLGTVRLQVYAVCLLGVVFGVSYVKARDRALHVVGELGMGLLEGLGGFHAGVEQVELNGERFTFGAAVTHRDPDFVVREFEFECAHAAGSLAEDIGPLFDEARKRGARLPERDHGFLTTMAERATDVDAAHGGCFVRPDDEERGSMLERLEAFASSGKLGTLGGFRYLRADRAEGSDNTRVLALASQGELDMDALIPEQGDAKGTDPTVATRPPHATRIFSARILGSGQGAYVYESNATTAQVLKHFDGELPKQGLTRVPLDDGQGGERTDARSYAAPQGAVVVSVVDEEGGQSSVIVLEFGDLTVNGKR